MSKNYNKRNTALIKKDGLEKILKETRQSDLEYKTTKNIKVENSKNKNQLVNRNNENSNKLSRQLTKQEGKITIKLKENNNDNPPNNENNDNNNIIEQIQKENESYKEKIKELEEKIEKMTSEYSNNIQKQRIELEQNEKQMKKLITTNKNLKNSLEVLTQRLDKVIINSNTKKVKIQNKASEYQELQHQLEIKERELKNQQQLINILKKDNKNIRELLNNFHMDEKDINLANKVQIQYREIMNLQKDLKEYKKLAHSTSQENLKSKDLKLSSEENKNNNITKKSTKLYLNAISPKKHLKLNAFNFNLNTLNKNKIEKNGNSSFKKRHEYQGLNSYINKENDIFENMFEADERDALKNSLGEGERFQKFVNKLNILDKAALSKEKEMSLKIKLIETKLKQKEKELIKSNEENKEKDNIISDLTIKNKELSKNINELVNQINYLTQLLTELDKKNENIINQNKQIKNTIFNIDGIIEAKSKEGNIIPILKDNNDINDEIFSEIKDINDNSKKENYSSKNESFKEAKNKSFSISNSNINE